MSDWVEGQWGPTKIRGGYSYMTTPCGGDTVWSEADGGSEWVVLRGLTAANLHKVTVTNPATGAKFAFGPKWETRVKFRRGSEGAALDLLAEILDATEIEGDASNAGGGWIIGGRRGGHR